MRDGVEGWEGGDEGGEVRGGGLEEEEGHAGAEEDDVRGGVG